MVLGGAAVAGGAVGTGCATGRATVVVVVVDDEVEVVDVGVELDALVVVVGCVAGADDATARIRAAGRPVTRAARWWFPPKPAPNNITTHSAASPTSVHDTTIARTLRRRARVRSGPGVSTLRRSAAMGRS